MPKKSTRPAAKSRSAKPAPKKPAKTAKPVKARAKPPVAKKSAPKARAAAVASVGPVTEVVAADQQHLLLLFIPIINGKNPEAVAAAAAAFGRAIAPPAPSDGSDPRPSTGVHFFLIHILPDGGNASLPMPIKGASVPTIQTLPGKSLLLVMSIYDGDFDPYIRAFFEIPDVVKGLNNLMWLMDEDGLVAPDDPTSAVSIRTHDGITENKDEFLALLRRYNYADGRIPARIKSDATPAKYFLGGTFPGLTIAKLLNGYPDLGALYPVNPADITYDPASG